MLEVILLNTESLSKYLQGKDVDVLAVKKNADSNIAALRKCRNEESFQLFGREQKLLPKQQKNQRFEFAFKDTKIPRSRPSSLVNTQSGEEQSRDDLQLLTGTSASRHISRPST